MRDSPNRTGFRRRRTRVLGLAAAVVFVLPQVLPPRFFFDGPRAAAERAELTFHAKLLARNGMEALWTFDGPFGAWGWFPETKHLRLGGIGRPGSFPYRDVVSGISLVPGRFGNACRFPGRDDAFVRSGHIWKAGPSGFTVALWAKLRRLPARQDLFSTSEGGVAGFRLDGGRLVFDFASRRSAASVSCPFDSFGRFVHLAAVFDPAAGGLALYVDGRKAATAPASAAAMDWPLAFADNTRFRVRETLHGDLDDVGVWNRPLSEPEIRRIAGSSRPLDRLLCPVGGRTRLLATRAWRDAMAAWGRLAVPVPSFRRIPPEDAPRRAALVLSKGDDRRLAKAHVRSRISGCLSAKRAEAVPGFFTMDGETVRVLVAPFGTSSFYPDTDRMAYSLVPEDPARELPGGFRRIVLAPPERSGWSVPLAESLVAEETGLPVAPRAGTVALRVNGRESGVFLLRDFSEAGAAAAAAVRPERIASLPFQDTWAAAGEETLVAPASLSPAVEAALGAFFDEPRLARLSDRLSRRAAALAGDLRSPVPNRLRRRELARVREAVAAAVRRHPAAADAPLAEEWLLGGNRSAFRVAGDLDFSGYASNLAAGASVRFRSLDPDWLSDDGRVRRVPDDVPRTVAVEAELRDAAGGTSVRRLGFRLLPREVRLPALFVWTGGAIGKLRRADAMVSFHPAGAADAPPAWTLPATLAGGGGVRWRGNTSYVKANEKKLFNLATDVPHGLFPGSATRKLLQINAATDRLCLWNSLAYKVFREAPRADGFRNSAPRVFRSELYVNGRYAGLAEWAERIDGDLVGNPDAVFFRHAVASPRVPQTRQVRPSTAEVDHEDRYRELLALVKEPASPGWIDRVGRAVDLDNLADGQLLLNLFQNGNGGNYSFPFMEYMVWDPGIGRWFHVPWDFDCYPLVAGRWFATNTDRKLARDDPGNEARLAARWRAWREGPASDENLFGEFDRLMEESRGFLRDEIARYDGKADPDAWIAEAVRSRKALLRDEIRLLDERFGVRPAAAEP